MIRGEEISNDRLYEAQHIEAVLGDMLANYPRYFGSFSPNARALSQRFHDATTHFESERSRYLDLLHPENLAEYEFDPSAFKGALKKDCPIVRRCLQSKAKVMDSYRRDFQSTSGARMLEVAQQIVNFATKYAAHFADEQHESIYRPEDLNLANLDTETYTAFGVIGGGIRSHFLYNLYPNIFPNRSQNAIWAYYFLTGHTDYGFHDGSEFLMINPDGTGTQQNYFYPYDLFSYHALNLYLSLKSDSAKLGYHLDMGFRYVYVDAFLDHVADLHRADIDTLKPPQEPYDY